ncbi:MAG TPA: DMT family transporter [Thermoanaerobaculia bacterium]|nr:DMT family transporter [Thermoanaerobaculia bacterium]
MKNRWIAIVTIFLIAGAWGSSFTLIKNVLAHIAPEPFIFWRFLLAGAILFVIAIARRSLTRAALQPGLLLGALVFLGYWAQTRGLLFITPSRSALLTGLYVVMVPFCDRLLHHTRVTKRAWSAAVLATIGTTVLIGGFDARPTFGDMLTLFSAVCFALHVVYSSRYTARHSAIALAAIQVLAVGLLAGPPSLLVPRTAYTPSVVWVIVATAVVTTALAFFALMWSQAHVTATEAAVILAFEPVAASITSIGLGEESITRAFLLGGGLILVAMIVSQLPSSASMRSDAADPRHER